MMPKILIIDDDEELFRLLAEYLQDEGFDCAHAARPERGLEKAATGKFDALVLDVMLPGINGFEVLRRLRSDAALNSLPVLMLTARGEEIDRVLGLELGADDYLAKPFSPRELVARLRAILRRAGRSDGPSLPVEHVDGISINRSALSITMDGRQQELTMPEMRLLTLLLGQTGQVAARDMLYKEIFGHSPYPSDRSLDMLVSRLRKKLGPRADGSERIRAVRGEGYIYVRGGNGGGAQ